jgi:hypothetical protein
MTSKTKRTRGISLLGRLLALVAIGMLLLSLGAATAFAGTGTQATVAAGDAAPIGPSGGGQVTLNEDDEDDDEDEDDEDDEDDDEEGGGGGGGSLPATDTASDLSESTGSPSPLPLVAVLVIAGLVGGAVKVAAKGKI